MNRKLLHNEAAKVKMFATFWVKISSFPNAVMPRVSDICLPFHGLAFASQSWKQAWHPSRRKNS
jgi:hypothetical protein